MQTISHIDCLRALYPEMFSEYLRGREIEIGRGWIPIVNKLCQQLEVHNIKILQIKEKFGMLTVYVSSYNSAGDIVRKFINDAETLASKTCEGCGSVRDVTTGGTSWITTQCAACRSAGKRIFDESF